MNRTCRSLLLFIRSIVVMATLTAATCPTYDPSPPPILGAPAFTSHAIVARHLQGSWRETIHLTWRAPHNDTLGITEYRLLRKVAPESSYTLKVRNIPDSATEFYDRIDDFGFPTPPATSYKWIFYKLVAFDTLGRGGDTCTDSLVLLWQPALNAPASDTFQTNLFAWHFLSKAGDQISSRLLFWDSTNLLFESKPTDTAFAGEYEVVADTMQLPDSLLPLKPGATYYWGVKVSVFGGRNPESLAIRKLYVLP